MYIYLIIISIILLFIYIKGDKLFFRNDEWEAASVIQSRLNSFSGMREFVIGTKHFIVKHFYPIGSLVLYLKYKIFGQHFKFHFYISLMFHIVNTLLVFAISEKIMSDSISALSSAILFGFSSIIADTVLWPLMFFQILCTTTTLLSIYFHPEISGATGIVAFWFWTLLFITPFILETGLLACVIAALIFLSRGQSNITSALICFIPVILYIIGRVTVNGKLHIYDSSGCQNIFKSIISSFVDIKRTTGLILLSLMKSIAGLFAVNFRVKVADTLYILKPDFKDVSTIIATALSVINCILIFDLISSESTLPFVKAFVVIIFTTCILHYYSIILSIEPSNPNRDLVHQMPRHQYFPSMLLSIIFGYSIWKIPLDSVLIGAILLFIAINNSLLIQTQIATIKVYTDEIKKSLVRFRNSGVFRHFRVINSIDDYRLDWSFTEQTAKAFLQIKTYGISNRKELDEMDDLAQQHFLKGDKDKAIALWLDVLKKDPQHSSALNNLAIANWVTGNINATLQYLSRVVEANPYSKDIVLNYIQIMDSLNQPELAFIMGKSYLMTVGEDKDIMNLLDKVASAERKSHPIRI